jgi:hypothetical protein
MYCESRDGTKHLSTFRENVFVTRDHDQYAKRLSSLSRNPMNQPLNPYASPTAAPAPAPDFAPRTSSAVFIPASGRATMAIGLTVVSIVLQVALVLSLIMQILMLQGVLATGNLDPATAASNDQRQVGVAVATMICMFANFIALLVWIYPAQKNLPALQPTWPLEISPGWAVGWFFVPIMNLFRPFQAMRQLWNESDPEQLQIGPNRTDILLPPPPVVLVGWWWGLRIVSGIAGRVFARAEGGETIEGLIGTSCIAIALVIFLDLPLLLCQWRMIRTIQTNQELRYAKLEHALSTGAAMRVEGSNPFAGV